jgi:hypothetical protein
MCRMKWACKIKNCYSWLTRTEWTQFIQCHNVHHRSHPWTDWTGIELGYLPEKTASVPDLWHGIMRIYALMCARVCVMGTTKWNVYCILCFSWDRSQRAALTAQGLHLNFSSVWSHIISDGGRWMMYCCFHTQLELVQEAEGIRNAEISCQLWFTAFCWNTSPLNWLAGTKWIIKGHCLDPH